MLDPLTVTMLCKGRSILMTQKSTKAHQFTISFITSHSLLNELTLLRLYMLSRKDLEDFLLLMIYESK